MFTLTLFSILMVAVIAVIFWVWSKGGNQLSLPNQQNKKRQEQQFQFLDPRYIDFG